MSKTIRFNLILSIILFSISLLLLGCSESRDPKMIALAKTLITNVEPTAPVTLTDAKSLLAEEAEVVLLGRIGMGTLDPFEKGEATFVLSEAPEDHGDGKSHDASECPFCRRRIEAAPLAQVQFQDATGKPFPYSASKLLGLQAGQIVVVKGRGKYEKESDMLMISGTSLFVRP